MQVSFLEPDLLYLLLLAPLPFFLPRRAPDLKHAALRGLLLALLALALARPVLLEEDPDAHHVLLLDRSASVSEAAELQLVTAARTLLAGLPASQRSTVIELAAPDRVAIDWGEGAPDESLRVIRGTSSSSLGTALSTALRAIPSDARGAITLFSAGLATDRDWGAAVAQATARGIPVHSCALDAAVAGLRPVALSAIGELRAGQSARLAVSLVGQAPECALSLHDGSSEVARVDGLSCDGRLDTVIEFEPQQPGFLELRVSVEQQGTPGASLAGSFAVQSPWRALYVGGRASGGAQRMHELLDGGLAVEQAQLPAEGLVPDLDPYDLVVLDDCPAQSLPLTVQEELLRAVRDEGLGLLMSGGESSFGPGGYHDTPVADMLPVEMVQKEEKRDPSTTLVVIIDTSGSMGGNRVQLAKEVARLAIRRLLPHDKVGIVEFYGTKQWAAPIMPASNMIELERALNRMDAGGGTVILPAIEEAYYGLLNVQTRYKHVLILTDGGVESGAFEPLLRRMAADRMNVSTVLIGPEAHSEFLVTLANWGKGRFYSVPNRFNLPEILLKQPTSAKLPAYKPGVHALRARAGSGWWGAVDPRELPPLAGYVETRARPGAQVLLETQAGAHPLLASWQYGLGRVTSFMSEPTGAGTETWRDWDGYGALLARVMTRTVCDLRDGHRFEVLRRGDRIELSAAARKPGAGEPWARLVDETLKTTRSLEFRWRAPGSYSLSLPFSASRTLRLICGSSGSRRTQSLISGPASDVAPELAVDPRAALDLEALALSSGGSFFELAGAAHFKPAVGGATAPRAVRRLWPLLLLLALLTYIGDILWRRRPLHPDAV